jgi:DNA ligase 1
MPTLFKSLAELLEKVEATKSRLQTTALVADFLQTLNADEVEPAIYLILGRAFPKWSQKTLDVSWQTLSGILQRVTARDWAAFGEAFRETGDIGSATKAVFEKSKPRRQAVLFQNPLTIMEVRRSLEAMADVAGSGSREKKERLITALLSQASPSEAKVLVKVFTGEMRTGFHEGLTEQAVAKAFQIPVSLVQGASMALGDIGEVAYLAKTQGEAGLRTVGFRVFRPVKLMLAQTAQNVEEALSEQGGETAFEYKYDGARVQIHKLHKEIRVYTRRLTDATLSLPEIVDAVKNGITANEAILEGEVVAVDQSRVPIPFQHLMRRFKRVHGIADATEAIPLRLFLFDVLYLNGESLIGQPYTRRRQILSEVAGKIPLSDLLVTASAKEAQRFLDAAMKAGHEGVMSKRLDSPYTPGTRGSGWLKVKPVLESLDLVITAAEWGYGRRHNWLSDYYLAARDAKTGEFLDLGKTFKGLTNAEIAEMTSRLKALAVREEAHRIVVVPKIVVEVAYNEIQRSPKYKSQMALRFARITRIREDKSPEEVDTIQRVRVIYEAQFAKKGRYKTQDNTVNAGTNA